jgi:hypothetical protein
MLSLIAPTVTEGLCYVLDTMPRTFLWEAFPDNTPPPLGWVLFSASIATSLSLSEYFPTTCNFSHY